MLNPDAFSTAVRHVSTGVVLFPQPTLASPIARWLSCSEPVGRMGHGPIYITFTIRPIPLLDRIFHYSSISHRFNFELLLISVY